MQSRKLSQIYILSHIVKNCILRAPKKYFEFRMHQYNFRQLYIKFNCLSGLLIGGERGDRADEEKYTEIR